MITGLLKHLLLAAGALILMAMPSVDATVGAEMVLEVQAGAQRDGFRTFRQVDDVWTRGAWADTPRYSENWLVRRHEGVIRYVADWFNLSGDLSTGSKAYVVNAQGRLRFQPLPDTREIIDGWVTKAGAKPLVVMGTPTIPLPLIEGGFATGDYGFNIRQPSDYEHWREYLESLFQWLIEEYGREEVRTWGFLFGIESDWQTRCVKPGTTERMSDADNRREFIKMLDYFHAAAEAKLGPGVYVGTYWAMEGQAPDYLEHWGRGTNFATGKRGTHIGFCGVSDWVNLAKDTLDPFESLRQNVQQDMPGQLAYRPGLVRKLDYLSKLIDRYPELAGLEITFPETGYITWSDEGGPHPIEFVPADHSGAALYALRMVAYADFPRLSWAFNRYALGTGDQEYVFADSAKAPIFNAMRLQKRLAGQRQLPLKIEGHPSESATIVRALAAASDEARQCYRVLLVSFNETRAGGTEKVRLELKGLSGSTEVIIREYRVDRDHNNWWQQWTTFRERNQIPYSARRTAGGVKPTYAAEQMPLANNVMATLADGDRGKYLDWTAKHQHLTDFKQSIHDRKVQLHDGAAVIPVELLPNSLAYFEIEPAAGDGANTGRRGLFGKSDLWTINGNNSSLQSTKILRLPCLERDSRAELLVQDLTPNTNHTVVGICTTPARRIDCRIVLSQPDGGASCTARGDYSGLPTRWAITGKSDSSGRLKLELLVLPQPSEKGDAIEFSDISIARSS